MSATPSSVHPTPYGPIPINATNPASSTHTTSSDSNSAPNPTSSDHPASSNPTSNTTTTPASNTNSTPSDSNSKPTPAPNDSKPTSDSDSNAPAPPTDQDYPEQKHAGKVGYGPAFRTGPTFGDKIGGLAEEFKGKVTHNHQHAQHGHDVRTGLEKQRAREGDAKDTPFAKADEPAKDKDTPSAAKDSDAKATPAGAGHAHDGAAKEQAATVAPEGTEAAGSQMKGDNADNVKHIPAN